MFATVSDVDGPSARIQSLRQAAYRSWRRLPQRRVRLSARSLALLGILGVALALRVYGFAANLPDYPAPDEPKIVERAFAVGGGDVNPHFFRWPGSLLIYANTGLFGAYYVAGRAGGRFESVRQFQRAYQTDPSPFYVLARLLNVAAALATLLLIVLAVGRLGLLPAAVAALLIAVSPLHVQQSAVAYTDVPATLFLTAGVLVVSRAGDEPRFAPFLLGGFLIGLGTAIKYYVLVGGIGIVCAAMLSTRVSSWWIRLSAAAGAAAVLGFVVGCPFSVLAFGEFSADLLYQVAHQSRGHLGAEPIGHPALWYVRNSLVPAVGWPALLAACCGVVAIVRHHPTFLPLIASGVAYFFFVVFSNVSFPRYAVPHIVTVSIAAAAGVWLLRARPILAWLAVAFIVAGPAVRSVNVAAERGKEDTRAPAARWLRDRIPPSARVLRLYDGPRYPATLVLSQLRPVTAKEFAAVESGQIDVFLLMPDIARLMQDDTVLRNHAEVATSHLRLYEWVKTNATLAAAFRPGPQHRGPVVEVYMTSAALRRTDLPR